MDFTVAPEFADVYERLTESETVNVNSILDRLGTQHESVWARRGRIAGARSAWILIENRWKMYWEYESETTILLLLLLHQD